MDSKVFFICDEGFALHGAVMLKCLKNKTWSAEEPTCKGNVHALIMSLKSSIFIGP